jgi:hypothetical protein
MLSKVGLLVRTFHGLGIKKLRRSTASNLTEFSMLNGQLYARRSGNWIELDPSRASRSIDPSNRAVRSAWNKGCLCCKKSWSPIVPRCFLLALSRPSLPRPGNTSLSLANGTKYSALAVPSFHIHIWNAKVAH